MNTLDARERLFTFAFMASGGGVLVTENTVRAIFRDYPPEYEDDYLPIHNLASEDVEVVATREGLRVRWLAYEVRDWLSASADQVTPRDRPVVGWRSWRVDGRGRLTGTVMREPWTEGPGWTRAECGYYVRWRMHPAPDPECTCGLYAAGPEAAAQVSGVMGLVALAGRVIRHERGWRGELARPLLLVVSSTLGLAPSYSEVPRLSFKQAVAAHRAGISALDIIGKEVTNG